MAGIFDDYLDDTGNVGGPNNTLGNGATNQGLQSDENSGWNWGGFVQGLLPGLLGAFGINVPGVNSPTAQQLQAQQQAAAAAAAAKRRNNTILAVVAIIVLAIIIWLAVRKK